MTITLMHPLTSFWEVELLSGNVLNERETKTDLLKGTTRLIDWSLDLTATGDVLKIKQLRLYCPDEQVHVLDITEPGTAFQLKVGAAMIGMGADHAQQRFLAQLIGRVTNKENGDCECYVWDARQGSFLWHSNVYRMGTWGGHVIPLGAIAFNVVGLQL